MWQALRGHKLRGAKFRRQQPLGPYIVDFYCDDAALIVELDGAPHFPPPLADLERDAFMRACGLTVLRFENREVFESLKRVLRTIENALAPSPSGRGPG
jgi:adenine-specific DNA-methyltransferase